MIIFRFRVTFEEIDEVERIIDVRATQTLKDLHTAVLGSVKFKPETAASIYLSKDNWRKGKRFTDREVEGEALMSDQRLNVVVNDPQQKFLFITDDEAEWELKIEMLRIYKTDVDDFFPKLVKSTGYNPKQFKVKVVGAPTNEFEKLVDELMADDEPDSASDDDKDPGKDSGDEEE